MKLSVPRPMWIALPTVVLVITVVGVQLGWPIYRKVAAIQLVESLGGIVDTNPRGPDWFRSLIGEERMEPFDEVLGFALGQTAVTDADLERICNLTSTEDVAIADTRIGDAGLKHLGRLRRLRMLIVSETQITDAGLVHLKGLTDLEILDLEKTDITDRGLRQLQGLTNLASLNVKGTRVTDAGIAELERLLPDLEIER